MPSWVSNTSMNLDTGLLKIEASISLVSFYLWFNLNFNAQTLILCDNFHWLKAVHIKLRGCIGNGSESSRAPIKQTLLDTEQQGNVSRTTDNIRYIAASATYVLLLELPGHRRTLFLARGRVLPLAFVEGCYRNIHIPERICPWSSGEVETIKRISLITGYNLFLSGSLLLPWEGNSQACSMWRWPRNFLWELIHSSQGWVQVSWQPLAKPIRVSLVIRKKNLMVTFSLVSCFWHVVYNTHFSF